MPLQQLDLNANHLTFTLLSLSLISHLPICSWLVLPSVRPNFTNDRRSNETQRKKPDVKPLASWRVKHGHQERAPLHCKTRDQDHSTKLRWLKGLNLVQIRSWSHRREKTKCQLRIEKLSKTKLRKIYQSWSTSKLRNHLINSLLTSL